MQYVFGKHVLDTAQFSLREDDDLKVVEPRVLRLLTYLIEHRDRVIPRDELHDKIFGRRIVTDNALSVCIRDARKAVSDSAQRQSVIATVSGVGYRFVAAVTVSSHSSLSVSQGDPDALGSPTAARSDAAMVPGNGPVRIAVLPFEQVSGTGLERTIGRGLAHDLTTRIAYCRSMFVIARSSSFQFGPDQHSATDIASALNVKYLCQGSVQISGNKLRVSVALADAYAQVEIWTHQYEVTLSDALAVQSEIADAIVSVLDYEVQRYEMQRSRMLPATNLDAWGAMHRGLDHMYRFRMKSCDEAERFFRRSIDLEPTLARPYAGLSFLHYERAYLNLEGGRSTSLRRAFDLSRQAIDIDPRDPMGHWALSRAHFLDRDLDSAKRAIAVAVELNPCYANAQYLFGWIAMQMGDRETCLARVDLASKLSPRDPLIYGMHGIMSLNLALMGRGEEAMKIASNAMKHPDVHYQAHAFGVVIFTLTGHESVARDYLQKVRAVKPDYDVEDFLSVYAFQQEDDIKRIRAAFAGAA